MGRAELISRLEKLHIDFETVEHPAFFTVEEGRAFKAEMPGGHSKNLFVKDKKGALLLAVAHCDTQVDLVSLGKSIAAKGRLSFCKPEQMIEVLGVTPGSVTPFALINETAKALAHVVVDKVLLEWEAAWFHPLENTASTRISPNDLLRFIKECGHEPKILDLANPLQTSAALNAAKDG